MAINIIKNTTDREGSIAVATTHAPNTGNARDDSKAIYAASTPASASVAARAPEKANAVRAAATARTASMETVEPAAIPTADININIIPNNNICEGSNATANAHEAIDTADVSINNISTNNDVKEGSNAINITHIISESAKA